MFTPDSRYAGAPVQQVTLPDGTLVSVVVPPLPGTAPVAGLAANAGRQRLDVLAVQYLNAPTGFWRLCDANNAMIAAALAARAQVGIPAGGPG